MKRLAHLKNPSSESSTNRWSNKLHGANKGKKGDSGNSINNSNNNNNNTGNNSNSSNNTNKNGGTPYPPSGKTGSDNSTPRETSNAPNSEAEERQNPDSRSQSAPSLTFTNYDNQTPATDAKSVAPTDGDAGKSDEVYSKAGTLTTAGGGISTAGGGEGSTFSSPAPSVRSLTTTLTTVQSAAPSTQIYGGQHAHHALNNVNSSQSNSNQLQFSHQFPTTPVSAVPPHLAPHGHPTYHSATANNILTDNASMLTLASSSKRRRRNSLDTNASIRALPPSSIFSGSRESLPLSVLSGNAAEPSTTSVFSTGGVPNRPSLVGLASAERASLYSATLNGGGERSSFHTNRPAADETSVRSNSYSHFRNDSTAASLSGGGVSSPLGRISRRSSAWGEIVDDETANNEKQSEQKTDERSEPKRQEPVDEQKEAHDQTTPKQEKPR